MRFLEKAAIKIVRAFCIILTTYLFVQGLFTLCNIQRVTERTYYIKNNIWTSIIGILFFTLVIVIVQQERISTFLVKHGNKFFYGLLFIMTTFLVWWTFRTGYIYYGDMERIYFCAQQLLEGINTQWQKGGYAYMWPFQNSLILLIAFLLKIMPRDYTFYAFDLICIFFYFLTIWNLYRTVGILFEDKLTIVLQGILMAGFLPYAFLTMAMYGDPIGYGWAVCGVCQGIKYVRDHRLRDLLKCAVFMVFGICFKQNCLIIFVGLVIVLGMSELCGKRKPADIAKLGVFCVVVMVCIRIPDFCVSRIIKVDHFEGNSKWAHVAMGLQESEKAPGWYNCYNTDLFEKNDFDKEKTAIKAKESIQKSLHYFRTHPRYALTFFNKKVASEWNNPTFECFHVQNSRATLKELTPFVKSTINDGGKINMLLIWFFDVSQSILLFGILIYFACHKCDNLQQMFFGILFIGAFLFWLFWEAKGRYVAPFFFMMIPYAVSGYVCLTKHWRDRRVIGCLAGILVFVMIVAFSNNFIINSCFKMQWDTTDYYTYIHEYNKNFLSLKY